MLAHNSGYGYIKNVLFNQTLIQKHINFVNSFVI